MAEHVILFQIATTLIIVSLFGLLICEIVYLAYIYFSMIFDFDQETFDIKSVEDLWSSKLDKTDKLFGVENDTKTN
ncbi:MAG: hypothetical protein EOL93_09530 [Epsilonproteobacteria bacterium]|nr:hypothetical protein [Campylobacterota bacterium]